MPTRLSRIVSKHIQHVLPQPSHTACVPSTLFFVDQRHALVLVSDVRQIKMRGEVNGGNWQLCHLIAGRVAHCAELQKQGTGFFIGRKRFEVRAGLAMDGSGLELKRRLI